MPIDENLKYDEVHERGARLLTALSHPQQSDPTRSLQLYLSLCGRALWLKHLMKPEDWTPIQVRPQYVFRDPKVIDRHVAYVAKRLGERMVAGRMAIALLRQAAPDGLRTLPKDIQRPSINQLAQYVLEDAGQSEPTNVERRIWAPSRPVIHIAAAAAMAGQELSKRGEPFGLESFLLNQAFIEKVTRLAEELKTLVAQVPKFPVRPEQLIPFPLG
jgi:hypothetical protein